MTIRQIGIFSRPLILLVLGVSLGCAQQMQSVKADQAPVGAETAQIQSITVSEDGSRVEIVSDKPIVYTYYMLENPPRIIVDIAQTAPGKQPLPLIVNKAGVRQLDVSRHEFGSGVLSRIDISLNTNAEISASLDQQNKNKLVLLIPVTEIEKQILPVAVSSEAIEQISEPQPVSEGKDDAKSQADQIQAAEIKSEPATVEPVFLARAPATAVKPGERTLTAIRKSSDSLLLETSAEPASYKAFKLTQPDRLVIDIAATRSALTTGIIDIYDFNLGKARIGVAADKLRVVFDATGIIPRYTVTKNSTGLQIAFGDRVSAQGETLTVQTSPKKEAAPTAPLTVSVREQSTSHLPALSSASPPATSMNAAPGFVDAVEFSQADNVSRIAIRTTGGCVAGQPVKNKKGYALSIQGCRLPANLQRPLDTSAFPSEITSIAPISIKGKTASASRIAVSLRQSLPNTLRKDGNNFYWDFNEPLKAVKSRESVSLPQATTVTVKTKAEDTLEQDVVYVKPEKMQSKTDKAMEEEFHLGKTSQTPLKPEKKYTGRKVTLEFSDADIKKIFQLLAEVSNQNILVSDDVTGTISLKLVNVPWDQALDVILENKGLGMQKDGNIVQIRPRSKMKSLDDEAVEMRLTEEKKMPLSTVIFDINFAGLAEIETQFKNLKSKRSDSSISSDARTNKIIVVDIDPNISKMRKLLEELDIPEKQVMIEARIVEASSTFARDIGVKWGFGYTDGSASIGNINAAAGSMGGVVSSILPTATTGGIATGVAFGKLLSNFQLDMRLSAAASVGQIKIVSTPKVMTVNNKPAKISQGQMIPYQNTSSTDGAKTEFIEAALSLEVTPHITSDGSVNMKIKASNNTAGVGSPPPINKKEATTELVVKDGETTVIGGIYVDSETEGETGVPWLADIPLLGNLFKSNSKNKVKNEMLIFITPRILN